MGHWILTIIDEEKDNVYIMDPLGARHSHDVWKRIVNAGIKQFNAEKGKGLRRSSTWIMLSGTPKQADGKTCGYCVMRYIKVICEDSSLAFRTKYARSGKDKEFYTQMKLDEVRDEWACHVLEWI
ncbi:hypothetical protein L3X38_031877 [Prunus dulcis]|uniref:Ubiquitin-like protease family profile domain-containing protein n=1 Tax=Prunus dulcis TaxID=3755 RepID=A0AAD4VD00_PRUDU|nr:hypothetical protein L3X38_031877 [Prunus dulcis]